MGVKSIFYQLSIVYESMFIFFYYGPTERIDGSATHFYWFPWWMTWYSSSVNKKLADQQRHSMGVAHIFSLIHNDYLFTRYDEVISLLACFFSETGRLSVIRP
jgi:hypothetical protein